MPTLTIEQALAHALRQHRAGRLADAAVIYGQILTRQPKHADALHLLGMLLHQSGKSADAMPLLRRAIESSPNQPVFHSNLGLVLAATGNLDAAITAHRRSLELNSNSPQAMNNLGAALHASGNTAEALQWLGKAVATMPDYTDARHNLAKLLKLLGNVARGEKRIEDAQLLLEELVELNPGDAESQYLLGSILHDAGRSLAAIGHLRRSLELDPASPHAHNNLGNALFASGSHDEALSCYRRALELKPDFAEACNNLGNVLKTEGRIEEAIAAYSKSVALQPKAPEPYSNLGNLLREAGQRELAMQSYEAALALDPEHALTHNNIANAYCETGEWDRAIEHYHRALRSKPDYGDAMNNLGTALEEIGRGDEAMTLYQRALSLDPNAISAPWNIALLELLRGEYQTGWIGYEHRWRQAKQSRSRRDFAQPMLTLIGHANPTASRSLRYSEESDPHSQQNPALRSTSEPGVAGQRVLLHAEQGFGDTLQFCRYVPMVAELGARVILECAPPLARLLSLLRGVAEIVASGEALPAFDCHCPLMSLPMVFGTTLATVPTEVPYLAADPNDVEQWAGRFTDQPNALRVGLVWAGGGNHQKDRHRSIALTDFAPLADIPGVTFFSLQLGDAAIQAVSPPAGLRLIDWTDDLHDFADTAAVVSNLDLVITVDTSVGHLAGALGKPVWTLLAFHPDWRWLLDREDSPWYPRTRLFRQTVPKDWTEPLARLAAELRTRISLKDADGG